MPAKRETRTRGRFRGWIIAATLGLLLATAAVWLVLAATCRPVWYQPPPIDYTRLRDDKAALVHLEDEISAAVNAGRPIRFTLTDDQVNRWLAAGPEMWPDWDSITAGAAGPLVRFRPGRVSLACEVSNGGWRAVVSATVQPQFDLNGAALILESGAVGRLPLPRGWCMAFIERLASQCGGTCDPGTGRFVLPSVWEWPNGRVRVRTSALEVGEGFLTAEIAPASTR